MNSRLILAEKIINLRMDVDGLPIIGPGVDYTQVNQFTLELYMIKCRSGFITFIGLFLPKY
jgi:hypothetical protein